MRSTLFGVLLLATLSSSFATAASFSFQGAFTKDSDLQFVTFSVTSSTAVTLKTYSYAGGVNSGGKTISAGDFDPLISLFNSSGVLIDENDDGGVLSPSDPVTGQGFDVLLNTTLAAGTYTVALGQFDNFASGPTLADGFLESDPNFTASFGCSNGQFCDVTGANRTANWALDILNVTNAATPMSGVPEPGGVSLLLLGASALATLKRARFSSGRR